MEPVPKWFADKFDVDRLTIRRYDHWTWSLRNEQPTLGASVLFLNRACETWAAAQPQENAELSAIVADIDLRLRTVLQCDRINYLMLMMIGRHVHFHVVPRYSAPQAFAGLTWNDPAWPGLPDLTFVNGDAASSQVVLDRLANAPVGRQPLNHPIN